MDEAELRERIARGVEVERGRSRAASVVIALVPDGHGSHEVVLEVRASTLDQQPGEVCCPGGHIEAGEGPREAAVRETCEELLVSPGQVRVVGEIGVVAGPGGLPLHAFVAILDGYRGTFSTDEVSSVFSLPASWIVRHDPDTYEVRYDPKPPADFPWDRVEGGQAYRWHSRREEVPFYDTEPVVWGATARVLQLFAQVLRAGGADLAGTS